jgi:thioredoxin 1
MPVFDSPITTDDTSLNRVLGQKLPVLLYLYSRADPALDSAVRQAAKDNAGEILVARIDVSANPSAYARFGRPALPALVTLDGGNIESRAASIRPGDVEAHADFLTGHGPMPLQSEAESEAKQASGAAPVHVSDASFARDVLGSSIPVLVDFWAPWCGPCHMVAPVLDRIAGAYAGRIRVAKLNVDENPQMAARYGARSIPYLVVFKDGEPAGELIGAHPQANIERLVNQALR